MTHFRVTIEDRSVFEDKNSAVKDQPLNAVGFPGFFDQVTDVTDTYEYDNFISKTMS